MPKLRIVGEVQTGQAEARVAALTKQVEALNVAMAKTASIPAGGTPKGFTQTTAALGAAGRAYNEALAASGAFRVENLKVNDVIAQQTDLLRREKLGWRDIWGSAAARKRMQMIKRQQLAMKNMTIRAVEGGIGDGHMRANLAIPKDVPKSWNTWRDSVGMFRMELQSASRVLLNFGKNTQWAGRQLMAGITYPVAAFGAAAGVMAYQVDKQFTRVQKVYNTTADQNSRSVSIQMAAEKELAQVRKDGAATALQAAKDYGAAMTDTLSVQADLAATGQKGAALQGATTEVMKNAMLGEIDVQTTTKATIALQQQLHLSTKDLGDTWAYLNAMENQTSLTMQDFATAIPIALGPLKQMGGTVQDLGTLLTAMVSRGVQVGKAANAIKATAQRLLRPSKQVAEEFRAITGADIKEIASNNQGNIMGIMQDLYEVTKDLSKFDRSKAFAGLFGSYQLSTMSAMVDGMGDLSNNMTEVQSQVVMAQKVGEQGAASWRKVQDQEISRFQESVSGKFKRTLETVKASLAGAGEPFLEVAGKALEAVNWLLKAFNSLSDTKKRWIAVGAVIIGLAGPAIMLVGLLANLVANAGLMTAGALKLISTFNLLNKAEWAQVKLDQRMEKELYSGTSAMKTQAQQLEALTRAMIAHNEAMAMSPGYIGTPAGQILQNSIPQGPGLQKNKANVAQIAAQWYNPKSGRYGEHGIGADGKKTYSFMKESVALRKAEVIYAEQIAAAQGMTNRQVYMENKARERTNNLLTGGNVAMGAMAASTVLMMQNTTETGQQIGQWMMMLSLGVPAVKGLVGGVAAMGAKAKLNYSTFTKTGAAVTATTGKVGKLAGMGGRFGASIGGARMAMMGMMGPVGWTAAALGTTALIAYKWYQHEKAITEEKRQQANAMYKQNTLLEEQLGIQEKQSKTFTLVSPSEITGMPHPSELASQIKSDSKYKDLVSQVSDKDISQEEKQAVVMEKYKDVLEATGGNAAKARLFIEALFLAAGDGALVASDKAEGYAKTLGDTFDAKEYRDLWANQIASIFNDDEKSIQDQGEALGKNFATYMVDAIGRAGDNSGVSNAMKTYVDLFRENLPDLFAEISKDTRDMLAQVNITDTDSLMKFMDQWRNVGPDIGKQSEFLQNLGVAAEDVQKFKFALAGLGDEAPKLGQQFELERNATQEIARQLGISEDRVKQLTTLTQLQTTWEWKLATATEKNAVNLYKAEAARRGVMNDDMRLRLANQVREQAGLRDLTSIYELNDWLAGQLTEETNKTADGVKKIGDAWRTVNFGDSMKSILQKGMEGVSSDLADAASESFDKRMNSAIDAAQAGWDNRIDHLKAAHQRAMDAFDKRWERRKKRVEEAYDAQTKGIDEAIKKEEKAEELRQKMFDAEMTRIDRLKEAANSNIDFNVALRTGNLDEAARIQNDMSAQVQTWALSDAKDASATRSQNKVDALGATKDDIDEAKQKRLDAMAELEDKQRDHLQKMQDQEEKSLQTRSENAMNNLRDQWEAEKKNLNDKLELFQTYTARNKKDLDRWLGEVGLSYDDFGGATMLKGETWAGSIEKSLKKHVRAAGMEIANSQMWEQFSNEEAKKTLQGMGFGGMGQFKKFIRTGELPSDFGRKKNKPQTGTTAAHPMGTPLDNVYHTGGIVGVDRGGRNGVARTTRGLHSSEVMTTLQKGEGVLNRDAMSRYGSDIVERMNKGQFEGGLDGPAGIMAAMAMRGLVSGVSMAYKSAVQKKQAQMAAQSAVSSLFGGGSMGNYDLPGVKPWVLEAADYLGGKFGITTVLGVGERSSNATSDHPKGLAIDLMTGSNTDLGNAITAEALRIQDVLDATYMIFNGRINSFDSRGWQTYHHPSGATDPTSMHRDHVHISFAPTGVTGDLPSLVNVGTGGGGKHTASDPGKGWVNTHDYRNGLGSRLYAFNDAKVIESRAITSGGSPGNGLYSTPYRSYGETMVLQDANGNKVRYAHLSPNKRFFKVGQTVPGGTIIGLSGQTGNASGPHTHFEWNGSENAQGGFAGYGIPLRTGAYIKRDNVPATLHKDEQVVDKKRTKKLYSWVDNFDTVASPWFNTMGARLNAKGMPTWKDDTASASAGTPSDTNPGSSAGNSKSGTVDSGTYNVLRTTSNAATQKDLARLFRMSDILSLTEFKDNKRLLTPWMESQGWGVFQGKGGNDAALTWNKAKMNMVKGGFHTLPGSGSGAMRTRDAAWGQFHTNSGVNFYQISAHTIGKAQGGGPGMKSQYKALSGLVKDLNNLPIILGGDLNTRSDQGLPMFGLKEGNKRTGIQHMLGTVAGRNRVVGGLSSDHPAILSSFDIPALAKGAQNIHFDNTLANLHKGEAVLTEDLNRQFHQGVANFANGGQTAYNINVVLNEADMSPEELAYKIQRIQQRAEARVAPRRTNR